MHRDDEKWVREKINELQDVKIKLVAWECYKNKYTEEYDREPLYFKKCNTARRAANNALRIYIDKVTTHQTSTQ